MKPKEQGVQQEYDLRGKWKIVMKRALRFADYVSAPMALFSVLGAFIGLFLSIFAVLGGRFDIIENVLLRFSLIPIIGGVSGLIYLAWRERQDVMPEADFRAWIAWLSKHLDENERVVLNEWIASMPEVVALSDAERFCRRIERSRRTNQRLISAGTESNKESI